MLKIGLTGGIGSGKSTVTAFFQELGVPVIDADMIARKVLATHPALLPAISEHFGKQILDAEGHLNRTLLRKLIFEQVNERAWLEKLLHPAIVEEIHNQTEKIHFPYCIIVIPLLIETMSSSNLVDGTLVDRILVVDATVEMQIQRTQRRDKIAPLLIKKILHAQATREQRLQRADDVVHNDDDLNSLKKQVLQLHERYLQLGKHP